MTSRFRQASDKHRTDSCCHFGALFFLVFEVVFKLFCSVEELSLYSAQLRSHGGYVYIYYWLHYWLHAEEMIESIV